MLTTLTISDYAYYTYLDMVFCILIQLIFAIVGMQLFSGRLGSCTKAYSDTDGIRTHATTALET